MMKKGVTLSNTAGSPRVEYRAVPVGDRGLRRFCDESARGAGWVTVQGSLIYGPQWLRWVVWKGLRGGSLGAYTRTVWPGCGLNPG
jgi:hypothetical protein